MRFTRELSFASRRCCGSFAHPQGILFQVSIWNCSLFSFFGRCCTLKPSSFSSKSELDYSLSFCSKLSTFLLSTFAIRPRTIPLVWKLSACALNYINYQLFRYLDKYDLFIFFTFSSPFCFFAECKSDRIWLAWPSRLYTDAYIEAFFGSCNFRRSKTFSFLLSSSFLWSCTILNAF